MPALDLLVLILIGSAATWRLTHMLLYESGPFGVLRLAREKLGVVYDSDDVMVGYKYEITVCMWCLSMWVGGMIAALLRWVPWAVWLLMPFVFSAAAALASEYVTRTRKA